MVSPTASRLWLAPLLLSGLALVLFTVLVTQPVWSVSLLGRILSPALVPPLIALFVGGVVLYCRATALPVQGTDFVEPLRRLFFGPGLLSFLAATLLLTQQTLAPYVPAADQPVLLNGTYVVCLGLLAYFLSRAFYVWQGLLLFRATPRVAAEWRVFEALLLGTTLISIVLPAPAPALRVMMGILLISFGAYLNFSNQRWVTHLLRAEKTQAFFLHLALLLTVAVFWLCFHEIADREPLLGSDAQRHLPLLILVLTAFNVAGGLLVTGFNFPAAAVYEQRRDELLDFQRQCQEIQRSASPADVYERLLAAAQRALDADAAWLQPPGATTSYLSGELTKAQTDGLRQAVHARGLDATDYVSHDLNAVPDFAPLELAYQSLLTLPLEASSADDIPGLLGLLKRGSRGFDRGAVGLAQVFVNQTMLTLRNLRLMDEAVVNARYKRELKIASDVQEALIPRQLPADHVLDISVWAEAATEVGGDFYDFRQLSESRLAIIVGDVSGKGITAAFHVAQMKGIFHSLMQLDHVPEPDRFMAKANAALAYCLETRSFITASLYVIDYEQRGFAFARAGHCHTLYYNSMTEQVFFFQTPGLGLGIVRDDSYARRVTNMFYDFNPGDVMVIYTDGITEARSPQGEEYGEQRLLKQLSLKHHFHKAVQIRDAMVQDLEQFTAGAPARDDQTLLVIKFRGEE